MNRIQDVDAQTVIDQVARFILRTQLKCGAIPWFANGKLDPWDHSEAIMALNISGNFSSSVNAFHWLKETQNSDGSWYARYLTDEQDNLDHRKIETNFVAYPATALWHFYLCSMDRSNTQRFLPMIQNAIEFVIQHQNKDGDIQWAISDLENLPNDSLVTANASVLRSLECAINLADVMNLDSKHWIQAHRKLANALKNKPWRFDRTWESKNRFSMDWFYPILSGVFSREEAQLRLQESWDKFFEPNLGCRCVADEPWVTIAESCEMIIALVAAGQKQLAQSSFTNLLKWQDDCGGFWTGYQFRDKVIWPKEKTTWTAAAVALAADAIYEVSPASHLFTSANGLYLS